MANTILAINLNGEMITTKKGLSYAADTGTGYLDPDKIKKHGTTNLKDNLSDEEAILFQSYIYGDGDKTDGGSDDDKCVTYQVILTSAGSYELSIKIVEPKFSQPGERVKFCFKILKTLLKNL